MKNKPLILLTLATALMVSAGCKKSDMSDSSSISENANEAATNAWQKTKEVTTNAWAGLKESVQSAADYTYAKKDDFIAHASADVNAMDQKISELSDKAANASDSVKANVQAKLQDLISKRAVLGQKLDDVKKSTEANWNDVKTGFKSSYNDAKESMKQTWQSLTGN